ncbi:hypothetical protein ACSNOI_44905 [Actinomadura kijaniata]|uniref:hypothetical protein n=1 Tax=Actinomadura kijaniata TaxID=46161 RepID=UPI003F1BC618
MPVVSLVTVGLSVAGLVVVAFCAFKVHLGVRRFGRELDRARARLEPKHAVLRDELRDLQEARAARDSGDGVRSS